MTVGLSAGNLRFSCTGAGCMKSSLLHAIMQQGNKLKHPIALCDCWL